MGKSSNSHAKKSDKETQSPMLKIFKEIMKRENHDPEKANLLKEKRKNKRRRQYSSSQSNTEQKTYDSSGEECGAKGGYEVQDAKKKFSRSRAQCYPVPTERRDSWWIWSETSQQNRDSTKKHKPLHSKADTQKSKQQHQNDETRSCVSCALRKIISNEYSVMGCLLLLFTVTVIFAFMLVFKNLPYMSPETEHIVKKNNIIPKNTGMLDRDSLKRKIEMLNEKSSGSEKSFGGNGEGSHNWDDTLAKLSADLSRADFGDSSFREMNGLVETNIRQPRLSDELSFIFDNNNLHDEPHTDRFKNFYRKLIKTDVQIKSLKNDLSNASPSHFIEQSINDVSDRYKRSLFKRIHSKALNSKKNSSDVTKADNVTRNNNVKNTKFKHVRNIDGKISKRFDNETEIPTGIIYENKKLLVQHQPIESRKFPKCSHAPKDYKSHENQLKHPFYKNTQRLDELLDQFLDKNLNDLMAEPFGIENVLGTNKICKHPDTTTENNDQITDTSNRMNNRYVKPGKSKLKNELLRFFKTDDVLSHTEKSDNSYNYFSRYTNDVGNNYYNQIETTTSYELMISISTLISPAPSKETKASDIILARIPGRRLLQDDEEDQETLGYDDLQEVLSDDMQNRDEIESQRQRKKRKNINYEEKPPTLTKYNPPGVNNPNWKGALPLYPDELGSMIKHEDNQKQDTAETPVIPKDAGTDTDKSERDVNDLQYFEDYLDNEYDKPVKMAQAYSDYGVLDAKKESASQKNVLTDNKPSEHRIQMSVNSDDYLNDHAGRTKDRGGVSEGIKFEIGDGPSDDNLTLQQIYKAMSKHVKFIHANKHRMHGDDATTLKPKGFDFDIYNRNMKDSKGTRQNAQDDNVYFSDKRKRSLMSIELDEDNSNIYDDNNGVNEITPETIIKIKNSEKENLSSNDLNTDEPNPRCRRSVKPIDFDITKDDKSKVESAEIDIVRLDIKTQKESIKGSDKLSTVLKVNDSEGNVEVLNASKSAMNVGDFFSMVSDWFGTLDGVDMNDKSTGNDPGIKFINLIAILNNAKDNATNNMTKTHKDIIYPMYDSDMIDNIGHRSRVLLSIEDDTSTSGPMPENEKDDINSRSKKSTETSGCTTDFKNIKNTAKITTELNKHTNNLTNVTNLDTIAIRYESKDDKTIKENKTKVKRNAPQDNGLIFLNDLYDEEYNVKTEDKNSNSNDNFGKRPEAWFENKVKKLTDTVHSSRNDLQRIYSRSKQRFARNLDSFGLEFSVPTPKITKGKYSGDIDENDFHGRINKRSNINDVLVMNDDGASSFAMLTANMKEICKEAAKAVQQTRNLEVREDSKKAAETSGMMQQLLQLMSELVDYQVQQKTCLQLPPDLKDFLEWLKAPASSEQCDQSKKAYHGEATMTESPLVLTTMPSTISEKEDIHMVSKSECLASLNAVQELILEYNELSDEDKLKMLGVKEYLESQEEYLNKLLSSYYKKDDLPNIFTPDYLSLRIKRQEPHTRDHIGEYKRRRATGNSKRKRPRLSKFVKNFSKKHTRSTVNNYDALQISTETAKKDNSVEANMDTNEAKLQDTKMEDRFEDISNVKLKRDLNDVTHDKGKRNLKDVYYKAIEDAKKVTPIKSIDVLDKSLITGIEK